MPEFACPSCQKAFSVPAETSATRVRCPHCRQAVDLPKAEASWFFARNKKKHGPFSWQQLHTMAQMGTLLPDDMLLQQGTQKWVRAASLERLFPREDTKDKSTPEEACSAASLRPGWLVIGLTLSGGVGLIGMIVLLSYFMFAKPRPPEPPDPDPGKIVELKKKDPEKKEIKKVEPPPSDGASKKVKDPPPKTPPTAAQLSKALVESLNRHRQAAGLGSVRLDEELTRGCAAHAKYLAANVDLKSADASTVFDEDSAKPGYSDEGKRAGQTSMIAFEEPLIALERWMSRLSGRLPLLSAEMRTVGLGLAKNQAGDWICVLDPVRGRGEPIVVYPAPNQDEVPLAFSGGPEVPDAKAVGGFPITVSFPPDSQVVNAMLEMRDEQGKPAPGWLWTPEKPIPRTTPRNMIALVPRGMLQSNHVYRVKASAQVDGKAWSLAWSFTTEDDRDTNGAWAKKALARVNAYRAHAKLAPVTLDDSLSRGCGLHARYLVLNADHPAVQGLNAHDENLSLPGASEEGRKSGKASNISIGDYLPLDGLDAWMATLYHRVPILEPRLKRIGFGCARSPRFGWITVLNVGGGREPGDRPTPILYPVPNQTDVPLNFPNGGEEPNPIPENKTGRAGYPITAFFPRKNPLTGAVASLAMSTGEEVACWISSPEKPANPQFEKHQGTTICLIPREPLTANTTYVVHIRGKLAGSGEIWERRWKFTTTDASLSSAQGARQALDRLNRSRMQAGLSAVALDDKQSLGCQLHAEYLARNAEALKRRKASVNDEDPQLPGFTAEGLRAARQSDVFTNAPVPVTQIDDLLATSTRRVLLLDPTLQRIGFGCAHDVGRGWRCVLDLNGGKGADRVILYPAPGQTDVPTTSDDRQPGVKQKPLGFPITVILPMQANPRNIQAVLSDNGENVLLRLTTPDKKTGPQTPPNVIGLHPHTPLRPNRTYSITVSAIVSAVEWRQTWQFTTGER